MCERERRLRRGGEADLDRDLEREYERRRRLGGLLLRLAGGPLLDLERLICFLGDFRFTSTDDRESDLERLRLLVGDRECEGDLELGRLRP